MTNLTMETKAFEDLGKYIIQEEKKEEERIKRDRNWPATVWSKSNKRSMPAEVRE